jgi:hypothetical protein
VTSGTSLSNRVQQPRKKRAVSFTAGLNCLLARSGFDQLLERHLLVFADHAAEFYAGSVNDCRRALELARTNVANRPTRRAVKQMRAIAVIADDASAAGDPHELRAPQAAV